MKRPLCPLGVAAATIILVITMFAPRGFAQEEDPDAPDDGSSIPTGVTGAFSGLITTGSSYSPYERNARREITDIVVPGSVGAYPLKFTRTYNSRDREAIGMTSMGVGWRYSYGWTYDGGAGCDVLYTPDGRNIGHCESGDPDAHDYGYVPPPIEEGWDAQHRWVMADGGKVRLGHGFGYSCTQGSCALYSADRIIDPYSQDTTQFTTIEHDLNYPLENRITKVTEPGGRYLQFSYYSTSDQVAPEVVGKLKMVEAFAADDQPLHLWARYIYGRHDTTGNSTYIYALDTVGYSDGTSAHYTWDNVGSGNWRIITCDDPHSGPMRKIQYSYYGGSGPFSGLLLAEKNSTGAAVSSLPSPTPVPSGAQVVRRVETRGDGPARTFTYIWKDGLERGQPLRGFLKEYTDFFNDSTKTTSIEYYTDYTEENRFRFIKSVTDANNHTTEYVRGYSDSWAITKIIYHDGSFIDQEFTPDPGTTTNSHKYPYYLKSRTALRKPGDAEHKTIYKREDQNNPNAITRIEYPDGAIETFSYNAKGQVLTHGLRNGAYVHFAYNDRHLLWKKWNPTWNSTADEGDPKTIYAYYGANDHPEWTDRVKTETLPPNASGFQASQTYEYDRAFDTNGVTNHSGAAVGGRGMTTKITHADGTYQLFAFNTYGDKVWEENEMRQRTVYTYDEYGRVTSVKDPLNNQTTNSYLPWGQSSSLVTTSSLPFKTTLPSEKRTEFYYDANWRKDHVIQAAGTSDAATTSFTYDDVGNLLTQTNPRGKVTTYVYDSMTRVTDVDDPMVNASPVPHKNARYHTVSYDYYGNGNKEREIRANDQEIHYDQYDEMNRLLQVTTHRDATHADVRQLTYDDAGNIETRTDERGKVYTYGYDAAGRKTSLQYPGGTTEHWFYDNAGNLSTYTTRAGQVVTHLYDNRNRETSSSWSDATPGSSKHYDNAGRLLVEESEVSCLSYTYDDAGRLTSETQQTAPDFSASSIMYHYDGAEGSDGKRTSIDYPYGAAVNYTYTNRNQIQNITSGSISATYTYDVNGNEGTRTLNSNGVSESCTYNDVDRLTLLNHVKDNTSLSKFDYTHNKVNDCLTRMETVGGTPPVASTDTYAYDLDDQVTEARYNFHDSTQDRLCNYSYDPTGNREVMTDSIEGTKSYSVNDLNQYTVAGGESLQYDLNGNLTTQPLWEYIYDAQNRLLSATNEQNGIKVEFTYDPRNRCVSRSWWTPPQGLETEWEFVAATYFYYDGWDLLEEHGDHGELLARYLHGAREDELIAKIDDNGPVYYHTDAEGSVVALTDTSGAVVERYTYDIFGKPTFRDSTSQPINGSTVGNRFLFTGREWLADLELYDYRNRVYSAEFGRFLQTDPKSFDADPSNLYRYCGNEPIDRVDPMGLADEPKTGKIVLDAQQRQAMIDDLVKRAVEVAKSTAAGKNIPTAKLVEMATKVANHWMDAAKDAPQGGAPSKFVPLRDGNGNQKKEKIGAQTGYWWQTTDSKNHPIRGEGNLKNVEGTIASNAKEVRESNVRLITLKGHMEDGVGPGIKLKPTDNYSTVTFMGNSIRWNGTPCPTSTIFIQGVVVQNGKVIANESIPFEP